MTQTSHIYYIASSSCIIVLCFIYLITLHVHITFIFIFLFHLFFNICKTVCSPFRRRKTSLLIFFCRGSMHYIIIILPIIYLILSLLWYFYQIEQLNLPTVLRLIVVSQPYIDDRIQSNKILYKHVKKITCTYNATYL